MLRTTSGAGRPRSSPARAPLVRAASIASSRPRITGSTGTRPVMSRIRCTPGSTVSPTQTTKPWRGLERAPARVQQRAEHRGVHEGRGREVDDDAAAAAQRLVEALAQGRRGVDVVLALDDDDDDVAGGVVEHDRVRFHRAGHDYPTARRSVPFGTDGRPAGALPGQARLRRDAGAGARARRADGGRAALRRAGASRPRDALGPAARARGHARLLGGPEGHPARSRAQPPRGAHGGPPARVPRVPRRHPGGLLRRRARCGSGTAGPTSCTSCARTR